MAFYQSPDDDIVRHPAHERMFSDYDYDEIYVKKNWVPFEKGYESVISNLRTRIDYNSNKKKRYDVVLLESPVSLHAASKISRIYPSANIVYLNSNWMLWPEIAHPFYEKKNSISNYLLGVERKTNKNRLLNNLRYYVDSVISVSKFCDKKLKELIEIESYIAEPHIEPEKYRKLVEISPNLKGEKLIFIGENRNHKGLERIIDNWSSIKSDFPKAEISIIGEGHDKVDKNDINVKGYISNEALLDEISKSSLYVHPARFENFGISVLESMRGGVPALVTENTGVKDVVSKVDDSLVVENNDESIIKGIKNYLNKDIDSRDKYSEIGRSLTDQYTLDRSKKQVDEALELIMKSSL